jgi:hypothetical protein
MVSNAIVLGYVAAFVVLFVGGGLALAYLGLGEDRHSPHYRTTENSASAAD